MQFFQQQFGIDDDSDQIRKQQMMKVFSQMPANPNKCTFEEILNFLDSQLGEQYDRTNEQQLKEMCKPPEGNDQINIETFVNAIIDVENNLRFRIQHLQDQLLDFKTAKMQIIEKKNKALKFEGEQSESHLLVQVIEAISLEAVPNTLACSAKVRIQFGYEQRDSTEKHSEKYPDFEFKEETQIVNSENPIWNETFDLVLKAGVNRVIFEVIDRERTKINMDDLIGELVISLDRLAGLFERIEFHF